jgi:hypothetical protein
VFVEHLEQTVARFQAGGATVWFINQVPVQDVDLTGMHAPQGSEDKADKPGASRAEYLEQQRYVRDALTRHTPPGLKILGPAANWFDGTGHSLAIYQGRRLYRDPDHLTPHGAAVLIMPSLEPVFDLIASVEKKGREAR